MSDAVKVTNGAFRSLLGLDATQNTDPEAQPENITFVGRFTKSELKSYLNRLYIKPELQRGDLSAAGISSYLKPLHREIGQKRLNVDKMRALAPEIEQSKILVSSSILSPNDLQDGVFLFSFDDVPALASDPDLQKQISDVYDQFYNKTLKLGIKSYDWIGEIQYSSGSKPVLILPIATQMDLYNRHDDDVHSRLFDFGPGFASIDDYYAKSKFSQDADFLFSGKKITWQEALNGSPTEMVSEMVPVMESYGIEVPSQLNPNKRRTVADVQNGTQFVAGLEDMLVNLRTKLAEGEAIRVSENPEILRFATKRKPIDKMDVYNKLQSRYAAKKHPEIEEVVELQAHPDGITHTGHPTIMELPAESVIPIHVPGAPEEHIGYFVLLDQHGQPLTIEASGMGDGSTGCQPGNPSAAYETLFGSGCCSNTFFSHERNFNSAGNVIFQTLLDKYLKARMKGIFGRDDLTLGRFNAIATMLFQRLLHRKRTMLVFVPPTLLHYFAFAYDKKSGYGLSRLEDAAFILSLRTTLMMADVAAKVNEAIEHKTISFDVDDKNANIEGLMDTLTQVFTAKSKLNGSIDPSEIMGDMSGGSLTLLPKNMPGLNGLDVTVDTKGGQSTRVDSDLMEQLTNLLVSHLDVPPAALNQMSDPEFSRSLVTYNLFFAKKITRYQRIWCDLITEFIRDHSLFDIPFKKALAKRLQAAAKHHAEEKLPEEVEKMAAQNPNEYQSSTKELLTAILNNVRVNLPSPQIVVDKSQFEEIRNFMGNLDEMANQFYPQDLIPQEDQIAQAAIPVVRAKWKRDMLLKFLERVGSFSMVEVPTWEEFEQTDLFDSIQFFQNIGSGLKKQRNAVTNDIDQNGGMGMGMDMGGGMYGAPGGMDMGGGLGEDLGGGDLGGGMTEPMPDFETETKTTQSQTSTENEFTSQMYFDAKKKK